MSIWFSTIIAGSFPEPASHPYPLNAMFLTAVYTCFIHGMWSSPHCENTQVLREAITEDDDDELYMHSDKGGY